MSKDKQETVTIEVPVEFARCYARDPWKTTMGANCPVTKACRAALEARKTKLERWRDDIGLPWTNSRDERWTVTGDGRDLIGDDANIDHARLMAAAPQLLEALIQCAIDYEDGNYFPDDQFNDAIRAALPEDVAAEVLGDEEE